MSHIEDLTLEIDYLRGDPQALGGHTTEAMTLRYIRDRATVVAMGPTSISKREEKAG